MVTVQDNPLNLCRRCPAFCEHMDMDKGYSGRSRPSLHAPPTQTMAPDLWDNLGFLHVHPPLQSHQMPALPCCFCPSNPSPLLGLDLQILSSNTQNLSALEDMSLKLGSAEEKHWPSVWVSLQSGCYKPVSIFSSKALFLSWLIFSLVEELPRVQETFLFHSSLPPRITGIILKSFFVCLFVFLLSYLFMWRFSFPLSSLRSAANVQ